AGDFAGFPNGRRVFDDVFTIELRAIAGLTYPLIDKTFTPDAATSAVTDGLTVDAFDQTAQGTVQYLPTFPYLGTPHSGYDIPAREDPRTCRRSPRATPPTRTVSSTITAATCRPAVKVRSCSTSATRSARSLSTRRPRSRGSNSNSHGAARPCSSCTPKFA